MLILNTELKIRRINQSYELCYNNKTFVFESIDELIQFLKEKNF